MASLHMCLEGVACLRTRSPGDLETTLVRSRQGALRTPDSSQPHLLPEVTGPAGCLRWLMSVIDPKAFCSLKSKYSLHQRTPQDIKELVFPKGLLPICLDCKDSLFLKILLIFREKGREEEIEEENINV